MPPIEALEALSKEFGVTINELIAGERLSEPEFREKADENVLNAWQDSAFTLKERQEYFKRRWRKRHLPVILTVITLIIVILILLAASKLVNTAWLFAIAELATVLGITVMNNAMMAYVERKTFDRKNEDEK